MWESIQIEWRPSSPPLPTDAMAGLGMGPGAPSEHGGGRGGGGGHHWGRFIAGLEPEWLVTNGIGGFASGSVLGIHRRRYHGLLTAAWQPPVRRHLMWVKNDEWLLTPGKRIPLGANDYGGVIHPDGWRGVHSFRVYPFPTTVFLVAGHVLERTVFMVHGQNTTVVLYRFDVLEPGVELEIELFVNVRDYHHTRRRGAEQPATTLVGGMPGGRVVGANIRMEAGAPVLTLGAGGDPGVLGGRDGENRKSSRGRTGPIRPSPDDPSVPGEPPLSRGVSARAVNLAPQLIYVDEPVWYENFHYAVERLRGLDAVEDHWRPGKIRWRPRGPGDMLAVVGHCPVPAVRHGPPWEDGPGALLRWAQDRYKEAVERRRSLLRRAGFKGSGAASVRDVVRANMAGAGAVSAQDIVRARLVLAADAFVVRRHTTDAATILAGYPWFTDWGRDAMISLPGLLLATGRLDEAREVLMTFAAHRADGLIPNRFPDDGGEPLYNAVDASLWFIWALWHYDRAAPRGDRTLDHLLPVAEDVVRHYMRGTRHGIGTDGDGLVRAAEAGLQLTWMDAKAGDWVVTPRAGAPVEVNALWYNALRTVATLSRKRAGSANARAAEYNGFARRVRRAFLRRFLRDDGSLNDVVAPSEPGLGESSAQEHRHFQGPGSEMRANQLFATSLPFAVLPRPQAQRLLRHAARQLLTPVGLRTLAADDPAYVGQYGGDQLRRDAAYHQGTVWPWLLGAFVDGWRRHVGPLPAQLFAALETHLVGEGGLGHVAEIFTGDAPHGPRGCFAQAWSVAEWLRVGAGPRGSGLGPANRSRPVRQGAHGRAGAEALKG